MTRQEIGREMTKLHRQLSALRGQTTRALKADKQTNQLLERRRQIADQIAVLERAYASRS